MRRLLLTVFALMVLLPSVAFARSEYLCRFDGQLRASCCCPTQVKQHDAPGLASVQQACCCTVVEGAPSRAQPATADSGAGSRALPAFIAPVVVDAAVVTGAVSVVASLPRSMAPPDCRRDLFVRHCAFLL